MGEQDFFRGIAHTEVPWGERTIWVPVFYYDVMSIGAQFLAPLDRVKALLPSPRMHPLRVTPWHGLVAISAYAYRDCDLGPYNEVSIGIPFSLDKPSPAFVGTLFKMRGIPKAYVHHLPVTTEIARAAGVEFAGYPKFVADIAFEEQGDWVSCRLSEEGTHILTLTCRKQALAPAPRYRMHIFTAQERLLRCEIVLSGRDLASGRSPSDVRLELGDHAISQELDELQIGKLVGYQYTPQYQAILMPVVESYAIQE